MNRAAEGVHLHGLAGNVLHSARTLTRRVTLSAPSESAHPPVYKDFRQARPTSTAGFRLIRADQTPIPAESVRAIIATSCWRPRRD